ncbi:coenzyme A pyrophosphatase [Thalassotalea insulae]|uniref:Coenzyme A pyrophosphatase n=1 Tax=Thalassotalea insulae TaxID=2056778 RepID=A0ABQ6GMT5_9GAMM|nr:CoA pyrophosphatase [Thalassotalea insulae]GLX77310.1 coenzyme A pyrophosphatase [Thalassotalea insulae]
MTKDEFLHKFQLSPLLVNDQQKLLLAQPKHLRQSAVLIVLIEQDGLLQVLLTKRANHLKHHSGQICFPGGKVEQSDNSFIDTALREAQEEIGLSPDKVSVIGQLHPYQTISGFSITPVVAILEQAVDYQIDNNEVAEVFQVPLRHFLNANGHFSIDVQHQSGNHQVHFMPYQHYNIWGATAAILKDLIQLITP